MPSGRREEDTPCSIGDGHGEATILVARSRNISDFATTDHWDSIQEWSFYAFKATTIQPFGRIGVILAQLFVVKSRHQHNAQPMFVCITI